jgi:hypothetical protein
MIAFEVYVNKILVCTAGVDDADHVFSQLNAMQRPDGIPGDKVIRFFTTGLRDGKACKWVGYSLSRGDRIEIRIVETAKTDPPRPVECKGRSCEIVYETPARRPTPLLRSISHILAALFTNRNAFHRQWKNPGPAERWDGDWLSEANGHHGALKCLLTQKPDGNYQAFFHAVYAKFLTVCYSVELHGEREGEKLNLVGEADLGTLSGGIYHYSGEADRNSFHCAYRCKYDHGVFRLERFR